MDRLTAVLRQGCAELLADERRQQEGADLTVNAAEPAAIGLASDDDELPPGSERALYLAHRVVRVAGDARSATQDQPADSRLARRECSAVLLKGNGRNLTRPLPITQTAWRHTFEATGFRCGMAEKVLNASWASVGRAAKFHDTSAPPNGGRHDSIVRMIGVPFGFSRSFPSAPITGTWQPSQLA